MGIKIENSSKRKSTTRIEMQIEKIFKSALKEHIRGIEKIRLVDSILDQRLRTQPASPLPGLYHPRQGTQSAWIEISLEALLPSSKSIFKRILPQLTFKNNLAAVIFSLIGQHYFLTLRHSVKRTNLESSVRSYTEKNLRNWSEQQNTMRSRLLKPFQPSLEKWSRSLRRYYLKQQKKVSQ